MNTLISCLLLVATAVGLTGCGAGPDMGPVGAGLAVIGIGIIIAAAILRLFGRKGGGDE